DILVKADKVTMANSLELRVPFLDREVYEVASRLPHSEKIAGGTTKYALRKALERIVPAHVLHRKKLGFPVPTRHWLAGPELHDWARDHVLASGTDEFVDKAAVLRMLDEHRRGDADHSRRIWTMLCFMIWHGIFVEGRITPQIEERDYPVRLSSGAADAVLAGRSGRGGRGSLWVRRAAARRSRSRPRHRRSRPADAAHSRRPRSIPVCPWSPGRGSR